MRSDEIGDTPWDRFEHLLSVLNIDRATVTHETGISQQTMTNWKRRGVIGAAGARLLRVHYGVSPDWLNDHAGPMFVPDPDQEPDLVQLIGRYRRLTPAHRDAVLRLVNSIAESDAPAYAARKAADVS